MNDEKKLKLEGIIFLISAVAIGLAGSAIPIWYVHTHLNTLPEPGVIGGIIFDLIVICFGMSFMVAWMFIWYKVKKLLGLI